MVGKNDWYKHICRRLCIILAAGMGLLFFFLPARSMAAGLLIADGGFGGILKIVEHDVHVTINNGIAVTDVTQVFENTENRQVEALFTFPVPKGASVAGFSMWINGKEMVGEVVEKKRAREIYNSYKRKRRDPGLLEQVDYRTFEMRIYPINAHAKQKVRISYYQELNVDHDNATYIYPLSTVTRKDINSRTTEKFAINIDMKSAVPITRINSPSHMADMVVVKHSDTYCQASLETTQGSLASDVVVNYDLSRPKTGVDLITSKTGQGDGYFCLTLTTGKELSEKNSGMDYVFLLDISGSMGNDNKLIISRNALNAFIEELGENDRFEVMTFNVSADTLFGELSPGTAEMKARAGDYMAGRGARGGTVLSPAITAAYRYGDPDRTLNVVILSDGMTEQAERRTLMELIQSRPRFARVFCIGIGNEVNRPLLEQMAEDSGGLAAFVSRSGNFKRQAKAFRRKLMRPVATDLKIDISGIRVYDVEPAILPNLYHGSPVRIYGRYENSGNATFQLNGNIQGIAFSKSATLEFPEKDIANPEIERMWAWKRVDQLLKKADRTGSRDSVIDEIVRLGEVYSIVTEYTSFLVLENDAEYRRWQIQRRNQGRYSSDRQAQEIRKKALEDIRQKANADLGPQPAERMIREQSAKVPVTPAIASAKNPAVNSSPVRNTQVPQNHRSRDLDFFPGSGPVGPFFLGIAYVLRRRKMKK